MRVHGTSQSIDRSLFTAEIRSELVRFGGLPARSRSAGTIGAATLPLQQVCPENIRARLGAKNGGETLIRTGFAPSSHGLWLAETTRLAAGSGTKCPLA